MIHDLRKDELTLRYHGNLATSGMPGNAIKTILESRPEQSLCFIRDLRELAVFADSPVENLILRVLGMSKGLNWLKVEAETTPKTAVVKTN